ncbi:interleukin-15 receptor subunit alpha isoform X2 [Scleropages formosus]|uniref:interleukin-15 receptor subunit alpha isoform X2 n=1 Tax=Scleropages formosus TaxID=113540 RepID=UPI0008784FEF|nr:interleukin-15 receptor subunit alpha isoform X2 [Scleropages formosus]
MMQRVRVALCVLLAAEIGLHQDSRVARAGGVDDTCSVPPHKNHTVPFNQMEQYPEKTRLRYTCKDGYLRKAGTSSLIQCKRNAHPQQSPPKEANPKRTESPSTAYPSQQVETTSPGLEGQSTAVTLDHKTAPLNITTMTRTTTEKSTSAEKTTPTEEDLTTNTVFVPNETASVSPSSVESPKWTVSAMKTSPTQSTTSTATSAPSTQDSDTRAATSSLSTQSYTTATTTTGRNGTVEKHSNEVATSVAAVSAAVIVLVAFVVGIQLLIRRRRFSHLPVPQEEREFVNPTVTLHSQAAQLLNSPTDPAATNNS